MPMTDQQLNNYEGLLRQQADNAAQQRIGNLGNMNANYGNQSMTNTVNSFNYDRMNDYMNALGKREELAQAWQQTANQRALTAAQIKNMQQEHSRGLMGIALQRQQQKQQHEQHIQQLQQQRALQAGQLQHASQLQQAGFINDATQESRRQQSAIELQRQQLKSQKKIEEARERQAERHFTSQQQLAAQQLQEQITARQGAEAFRTLQHREDLAERQQGRLAQEAQHGATLAEQRRAAGVNEAFRQAAQNQNVQLQRDLQNQNLIQQHNQFQQNIADRNVDRAFQAQQARAMRTHQTVQQRENIAAQQAEAARRLGFERQVQSENIAERRADRTEQQRQFDDQMRQAKIRDIEAKRMNIESMKLARGKISHGEWLDKFNANLAHMGLQMKREKLDQLMSGAIQPPDESATQQQKLSWMASMLSNADADEGARMDRVYRREGDIFDRHFRTTMAQHGLGMEALGVQQRLADQNHSWTQNLFNSLVMPSLMGLGHLLIK